VEPLPLGDTGSRITPHGPSQGFNIRPQWFKIGVFFSHPFDRRLSPDANRLIEPTLRHVQLPHLAGVAGKIVWNDTLFRKFEHNCMQKLESFVGSTEFVEAVTLMNPTGRQLRSYFNVALSRSKGLWPSQLGRQDPPMHF